MKLKLILTIGIFASSIIIISLIEFLFEGNDFDWKQVLSKSFLYSVVIMLIQSQLKRKD